MHTYDFTPKYEKLLTPDIVSLLTQIHEYKGEQALFIEAKADALNKLVEIAKIQSTEASNKIEGIYTSDERLKKLVQDKTTPPYPERAGDRRLPGCAGHDPREL